jgi:hypothetical protein
MQSSTALRICALLCFALLAAADDNDIETGNPCTKSWKGPSKKHDLNQCNTTHFRQWAESEGPRVAFPLAVALLMLFTIPCVCCARACCQLCGGSKMRPGGDDAWDTRPEPMLLRMYNPKCILIVRALALVLLVLAIIFVILAYVGAGEFHKGIGEFIDGLQGLVDWVLSLLNALLNKLRVGGVLPDRFQMFETSEEKLRSNANSVTDATRNNEHVATVKRVVKMCSYPLMVPGAMCVMGLIAAVANIRKCLPMFVITVFVIVALPVGLMGTVMFVVDLPLQVACNEKTAQLERKPGFFQWSVIPQCSTSPIGTLTAKLDEETAKFSQRACTVMRDTLCDRDPVFSATTKPFLCEKDIPTTCTTPAQVQTLSDRMVLKTGAPECDKNSHSACSLSACATQCLNQTMRSEAKTIPDTLRDMTNIHGAVTDVLLPWADCNKFWDKILSFVPVCGGVTTGVRLIAAACTMCVVTMFFGIIVMFLGSKRYFAPPAEAGGSDAMESMQTEHTMFIAMADKPHSADGMPPPPPPQPYHQHSLDPHQQPLYDGQQAQYAPVQTAGGVHVQDTGLSNQGYHAPPQEHGGNIDDQPAHYAM